MLKKILFIAAAVLCSAYTLALSPDQLTQQLQAPNTVQGQFTQQRLLKSLTKPMQTSGQFALKKQTGLFWHVQKPLNLQLRVRAQGIAQWNEQTQTWHNSTQSGQHTQVKLFMALLSGDLTELNKQFNLSATGNLNNWTLQLSPKTLIMKQIFTQITINGDKVVRRVVLQEKQGDKTTIQFSNIQVNQSLNSNANNALK